jgi:hypothetical protein
MPEQASDKRRPQKVRFRAVFITDAPSPDALETAERLFARWIARGLVPESPKALRPARGREPDTEREDSAGTAPARQVGRTGRTERTHST